MASPRRLEVDRPVSFIYGVFYGLIAAVAAYHLLMYVVLRTRAYLAYGAYLIALLAFQTARTPGMVADAEVRALLYSWSFAALALLGYWLFRTFLELPERQPRADRPFFGLALVVALGSVVAPWMRQAAYANVVEALALALLFLAAWTLVVALAQGVRVARFFGVAYAGLLVGALARVASQALGARLGALGVPFFFGIEIGSAFQAVTLALGLADRIAVATEERDRAQRRTIEEIGSLNVAYARFVPREFLELLGKTDVREVALGDGIEREMTVLFTDVRSFTSLSEAMSPIATFGFINELLERTGPAVREHGGIVDKYVGDAIMALFPRSADDGLRAAIAVQRGVAAYNAERTRRGEAPIAVGVGLHRGSLMLGTIGETARMDGTVIADAVNVASRVEGLTKYFGAAIIISDDVRAGLTDPSAYALRALGRVAVQGKTQGIDVYEVLDGDAPERRAAKVATLPLFEQALDAFVAGRFVDAAQAFEGVLGRDGDDAAARYLQARAVELAANSAAWDGVDHAQK